MRRFIVLGASAGLAWAAACSSGVGDGVANSGPDGGDPSEAGGGGDGGGPGAEAAPPPYAGGDVIVSLADGDGGVVEAGAVSGKVTIHMVPATPSAIAKIDALVDGNPVGSATTTPFDVAWDSASVSNGAHTVSARAHDLAGATGSSAGLPITTSNFLLAGQWTWSGVTDGSPGFTPGPCSDKTFTVTFNRTTSTMTLPQFYLSCKAMNGASYSSKIDGFSKVVAPADYGGPITNTTGTVTTTFSSTALRQTNSFNGNTQSGKLTKTP